MIQIGQMIKLKINKQKGMVMEIYKRELPKNTEISYGVRLEDLRVITLAEHEIEE